MKKFLLGVGAFALLVIISCEKKEEKKAESAPKQEQATQYVEQKKEEKVEATTEPVATVSDASALADKKGCYACHDIDRKKVGPAYVDVAKKYAGKENAVEELVKSITKGSMGKWGSIPMTPQPVTQEEAKRLAEWILSLK